MTYLIYDEKKAILSKLSPYLPYITAMSFYYDLELVGINDIAFSDFMIDIDALNLHNVDIKVTTPRENMYIVNFSREY